MYETALLRGALGEAPGEFVDAQGVRVHFVRWGEGSPVVYVHGAKTSAFDFLLSIGDAVAERHTAVAFDRPGSGFSGRPEGVSGSPQVQAAVLRATAAELGVDRPVLVGHSFGAAVALAWALAAPEDVAAVVTLGGYVVPLGGPPPWVVALLRSRATIKALGAVARSRAGQPLVRSALKRAFYPDPVPEEYARLLPALALEESRLIHDGEDRKEAEAGLRALTAGYPGLAVPLVIVVGEQDRMVPPRASLELHRLVPGSELVELPATGHMPHFTQPAAVLAAIERAADLAGR